MRALAFILTISLSFTARAQQPELKLEKTTDKYGLKLKKSLSEMPSAKSQNDWNFKDKRLQFNNRLNCALEDSWVYPRKPGSMPRAIPDRRNIARMPNALPYFMVPDVAAIPNPAFRNKKHLIDSPPSN